MNFKSQKGFSLVEVGVGLVIIVIFMVVGITMLRGTYSTYRVIEQKNIALNYLIKAVERELVDGAAIQITDNDAANITTTEMTENGQRIKISTVNINVNDMVLTTRVETLPPKDGINYENSKVKLVTATIEYYIRSNDESSRRELELQTLKVEED